MKKILAVCGFGVGSSLVLKMSVQKALHDMQIEAEVENGDLLVATSQECDLICTSHTFLDNLEGQVSAPILTVKNYTDVLEIKKKLSEYLDILK